MKKLFIFSICMIMFISSAIPIFAADYGWEEDFEGEIGEIVLPEGTPDIDGVITEGEGWSEPEYFDKTNTEGGWGGEVVDITGWLYRAFDDENLYIAADISIPEYSLCEGEDWIDGDEDGNRPGWDGDVFILSLDPLQALLYEGFTNDPSVWYCFGLFAGDEVRVYRSHANEKEITDTVAAKGKTTETGWLFEVAIPWQTICDDIEALSFSFVQFKPEDLTKDGNMISASMIYYDRRYDPEAEQRITHSRYITVATVLPDGTPGVVATPWTIQAQGIYMIMEKSDEPVPETKPVEDTADPKETLENGETKAPETTNKTETTAKKDAVTTKKQTSSSSTNSSAPQTFDIGIALAVSTLAVSGIGIVSAKNKKK